MTYNILAINPGHNGSAALIKDGILDVYIEEERLSRFKRDGNPFRAMLKIMDKNHVDLLIIGGTGQEEHRLPWTGDDSYSALVKKFYPQAQVVKMGNEHHLQHAASAFYGSGFDEAVALVVDGCGSLQDIKLDNEEQNNKIQSYETESIYKCTFPGDIQPLFKRYSHNFGYAMNETIDGIQYDVDGAITTVKSYEAVTQYLGWGPIEAGKTMGLAPYGKKDPKIPQLLREGGRGDKNVFVPNYPAGAWIDTKRYGYLDYDGEDNTEWHYNKNKVKSVQKNIAWAVQEETQQYVGDLIERAVDMTGENNIVISGGYGLNVIANYYFKERFPELNIYIDPICHDGGTVVGAGKLFAHQQIEQHNQKLKEHNETDEPLKEHPKDPLTTLYLGSEYKYTPDDLKKYGILKDEGEGLINVTDVTAADVAKLIKDRKIVSIYQGRAEAGPRALGNRSILYDPTDPNGKDFVNNVKGREWFRPFAGSILQEHAAEWFDMRGLDETPYMMYAMEMQDAHIGDLPSITHVDGTCRIQTVTQEQNKNYYDLINEFYKLSGVPILFNTSFNLGGQPLVDTLDDAITTLFNSQLEYLYLPEIGKLVFLSNERSNLRPRGKTMGRYKSKQPPTQPVQFPTSTPNNGGSPPQQMGMPPQPPADWPTTFNGPVIGIDRDGVINEWKNVIKRYEDVKFINGSLEAIKQLRLKGHRVVLFSDQPNISRGLMSNQDVQNLQNFYMQNFGNAGIMSIDGFYYNQSDNIQDPYAKPNIGMLNRATQEMNVDFKKGYYVGDTIEDIKMAQKAGAKPILVRTGKGEKTEKEHLKGISSKYNDVQVFDNLLEFASSL